MHAAAPENPSLPSRQTNESVSVEAAFEQAGSLHMQGKLDQAEQLYRAIMQTDAPISGRCTISGYCVFNGIDTTTRSR
jgi:hypothetical protein